jgi:3-oxoacyl-[acyl-carrier-protein] synthase III
MWKGFVPMTNDKAQLRFENAQIAGIVTTVGERCVRFVDEGERLGLEPSEVARLQRALGLEQRYIVNDGETTVDLCLHSAQNLFLGCGIRPEDVQAVILVTQTPDYAAPSSAIALQHMLGLPVTTMAFDMRLGCSGFVYGLAVASSLVEAGLSRVLLCVGDTASRIVDPTDHAIAPIMGDAGSAILVERKPSKSLFQLYSDGSGARALIVPNSGMRQTPEDKGLPQLMHMEGAAVFNFTLQRVPNMISDMLAFAELEQDDLDFFVLHQPNKYILRNLQKRMKLSDEKMPTSTQSVYGNQNSASIPGTISGFLNKNFSNSSLKTMFAGFGIGLSWGACVVETQGIYAPAPLIGLKE